VRSQTGVSIFLGLTTIYSAILFEALDMGSLSFPVLAKTHLSSFVISGNPWPIEFASSSIETHFPAVDGKEPGSHTCSPSIVGAGMVRGICLAFQPSSTDTLKAAFDSG